MEFRNTAARLGTDSRQGFAARSSQFLDSMSKNINVNPNFYKVGGRDHSEGPAEKQLATQQKGKGNRMVAGGMRGTSKKK